MLAHIGVSDDEALAHVRKLRLRSNVNLNASELHRHLTAALKYQEDSKLRWQIETQARCDQKRFERALGRVSWWSRLLHSLACMPDEEIDLQVRLSMSP